MKIEKTGNDCYTLKDGVLIVAVARKLQSGAWRITGGGIAEAKSERHALYILRNWIQ